MLDCTPEVQFLPTINGVWTLKKGVCLIINGSATHITFSLARNTTFLRGNSGEEATT